MHDLIERIGAVAMVVVLFGMIVLLIESVNHDVYYTNDEAISIADDYMSSDGVVDLDRLMKMTYGYTPTNREGGIGS